MTPKECFGVVIRTIGLLMLLLGLYELLSSVYVLGSPPLVITRIPPPVYTIYGILFVLLSLYLLRWGHPHCPSVLLPLVRHRRSKTGQKGRFELCFP